MWSEDGEEPMKPVTSRAFAVACLAVALLVPGAGHAQAKCAITHIAGDLYRFGTDSV